MIKNRKAQLFTLDLLLALVPLTIILGISASAIAGVTTQIQDYVVTYSHQRVVTDAIDVLIKTSGEPPDWNSTNPPTTIGLANYTTGENETEPNYLDDKKVMALNDTTYYGTELYKEHLPRLIGNVTYYNLSMKGLTNISFLRCWSKGSKASASNIFVAERIVAYGGIVKISGEIDEIARISPGHCCPEEDVPGIGEPRIYYMSFYVAQDETSNYDFWLVGERYDNIRADAWVYDQAKVDEEGLDPCCWADVAAGRIRIFPIPGDTPDCTCPSPPEDTTCKDTTPDGGEVSKVQIDADSRLTEGTTNYVFIELGGNPNTRTTYYVIRAPAGICNKLVSPEEAGLHPVLVTLEVGR